jgi:group I intron endonuclease
MARRFMEHINGGSSNIPLQHAFAKYGISAFNLVILEEYIYDWDLSTQENRDLLILLEQKFLDLLNPRYNFSPTAGSPLGTSHTEEAKAKIGAARKGKKHSEEAKAKISVATLGDNNPIYGRKHSSEAKVAIGASKTGENNPNYGKVALNAKTVSIYSLDKVLVQTFSSQTAAAKYLGVSQPAISYAIKEGSIVKGLYKVQIATT